MQATEPKQDRKALEDLLSSRGWEVLMRYLKREQERAAARLADPGVVYDNSIQFLRGAYWAASRLERLPEAAKTELDNQILTDTAAELSEE